MFSPLASLGLLFKLYAMYLSSAVNVSSVTLVDEDFLGLTMTDTHVQEPSIFKLAVRLKYAAWVNLQPSYKLHSL